MTEAALSRTERTSWQQALIGPYYTLLAAGVERLPDTFEKFLAKYHREWADPVLLKTEADRKADIERAKQEAADIVALDPIRAAKRKEMGLED